MADLSWQCHSCGKVRGDKSISVVSASYTTERGIKVVVNRRYCNDTISCYDDAQREVNLNAVTLGGIMEQK